MKRFLVFALVTAASLSANAGTMSFTCKNADGSVIITRDSLVHLSQDDVMKKVDVTILRNSTANTMPDKGESLEFDHEADIGNKIAELKITSIGKRTVIAKEDGNSCEGGKGGNGPGFETESYQIKGELSMYRSKTQSVELSCVEFAGWSGRCEY